jgi:predicted amidohydrolase YtcJ
VDDLGHLGPGAVADLMVLPAAPFDEPTDLAALAAMRPVVTMMDGVVVHGHEPDRS